MGVMEIVAAIGILIGIIAGIVQVLDYLEKRREKKRIQQGLEGLQQPSISQYATLHTQKRKDWGEAPDISVFYGRQTELDKLEKWIVTDHCRVVTILGMRGIGKTRLSLKLGMGGIGKTDLSLKLARGIEDKFDYMTFG